MQINSYDVDRMKRIIIGVTGASGAMYGIQMLKAIRGIVESHLIISQNAQRVIKLETSFELEQIISFASHVHDNNNLEAPVSSGSFKTDGMIIIPCSIKSLSAIANAYSESLISRAADVTLKERRRLVLVVRETPLHIGHIKLMERASEMGAVIFPPVPAFYHKPKTIDDLINHTIGKILDLFDIKHALFARWQGSKSVK